MDDTTDILFDGSGFENLVDVAPAIYGATDFLDYNTYFAMVGTYSWFGWATTILMIVSLWLIFNKAKRPGWASIIPIYNVIVYLDVVGRPWWWLLLILVPIVNIVIGIILLNDLSKAFGQGVGYTFGLIFLPWIFYPILAFGGSQYQKDNSGQTPPPTHPTPTDSQSGGHPTPPAPHEPTPPTPPAPHEPPASQGPPPPVPPVPPTQM